MTPDAFLQHAESFFLVFMRVAAIMVVAPVFGHRVIPLRLRVLFALVLAATVFPLVQTPEVHAAGALTVIGATLRELLVGLLIGYAANFIFYAVQFAGDIASFQIGFTSVISIDPSTLENVTIMARLQMLLALTLYVLLDGHHFLVQALVSSFSEVPLLSARFPVTLLDAFVKIAGTSIVAALRIAAPILVATSLVHVALAVLSRTMPQLNIMAVSFPLVIGVGIVVLITTLPAFAHFFHQFLLNAERQVMSVMRMLGV